MKQFFKQAGKATCYILLFFGMQMIVTCAAMFFMTIYYVIQHADQLAVLDMETTNTIILEVADQTLAVANEIAAIRAGVVKRLF